MNTEIKEKPKEDTKKKLEKVKYKLPLGRKITKTLLRYYDKCFVTTPQGYNDITEVIKVDGEDYYIDAVLYKMQKQK